MCNHASIASLVSVTLCFWQPILFYSVVFILIHIWWVWFIHSFCRVIFVNIMCVVCCKVRKMKPFCFVYFYLIFTNVWHYLLVPESVLEQIFHFLVHAYSHIINMFENFFFNFTYNFFGLFFQTILQIMPGPQCPKSSKGGLLKQDVCGLPVAWTETGVMYI